MASVAEHTNVLPRGPQPTAAVTMVGFSPGGFKPTRLRRGHSWVENRAGQVARSSAGTVSGDREALGQPVVGHATVGGSQGPQGPGWKWRVSGQSAGQRGRVQAGEMQCQ